MRASVWSANPMGTQHAENLRLVGKLILMISEKEGVSVRLEELGLG
jgi:hypothetical protein